MCTDDYTNRLNTRWTLCTVITPCLALKQGTKGRSKGVARGDHPLLFISSKVAGRCGRALVTPSTACTLLGMNLVGVEPRGRFRLLLLHLKDGRAGPHHPATVRWGGPLVSLVPGVPRSHPPQKVQNSCVPPGS